MSELRFDRKAVILRETMVDNTFELPVESYCLLPDYCPDIFKILKTRIVPFVQGKVLSDNRLTIEGVSEVSVWYFSEESKAVSTVCCSVPFSKTVELPEKPQNPLVSVCARCYFENGRAVTPRRVDIRGGIRLKVTIEQDKSLSVISSVGGGSVQLHRQEYTLLAPVRLGEKSFHVTEDIEVPLSGSRYKQLLSKRCSLILQPPKALSNRVICKGELLLHLLYEVEDDSKKTFDCVIPISQLIDLEGVAEDDGISAFGEVTGISFEEKSGGDSLILSAEFTAFICCKQEQNLCFTGIDDLYSTRFELSPTFLPIAGKSLFGTENRTLTPKLLLETGETAIGEIFDIFFSFGEAELKTEENATVFTALAVVSVIGADRDGSPFFAEKSLPFSLTLEAPFLHFNPHLSLAGLSYTISGDNAIDIRPEIRITGTVYQSSISPVVSEVSCDEQAEKKRPAPALRITHGEKGETVWEIAKRCNTVLSAIMEENDLLDETLTEDQTLLIPIVEEQGESYER